MTTASLRDGNDIREVLRRERRFGAKLDSYDKYRDGNELTLVSLFVQV